MVDQASLERPRSPTPEVNGRNQSATSGVREGVGELLHDVVSLGELQAQLLAVDARESLQKAQVPAMLLTIGVGVGEDGADSPTMCRLEEHRLQLGFPHIENTTASPHRTLGL